MELKSILDKYGLIGVISTFKSTLNMESTVRELNINNLSKALKMVGLTDDVIDKKLSDLTMSEVWKVELASKLQKEMIIVGNMSTSLNAKEIDYMQKLFLKLNNNYHKKIVVIDNSMEVFINFVKKVYVIKNKEIVYNTEDFFDKRLYDYTNMPKIVEFINYVNQDGKVLNNNTDIYELIKDIYRSAS